MCERRVCCSLLETSKKLTHTLKKVNDVLSRWLASVRARACEKQRPIQIEKGQHASVRCWVGLCAVLLRIQVWCTLTNHENQDLYWKQGKKNRRANRASEQRHKAKSGLRGFFFCGCRLRAALSRRENLTMSFAMAGMPLPHSGTPSLSFSRVALSKIFFPLGFSHASSRQWLGSDSAAASRKSVGALV